MGEVSAGGGTRARTHAAFVPTKSFEPSTIVRSSTTCGRAGTAAAEDERLAGTSSEVGFEDEGAELETRPLRKGEEAGGTRSTSVREGRLRVYVSEIDEASPQASGGEGSRVELNVAAALRAHHSSLPPSLPAKLSHPTPLGLAPPSSVPAPHIQLVNDRQPATPY